MSAFISTRVKPELPGESGLLITRYRLPRLGWFVAGSIAIHVLLVQFWEDHSSVPGPGIRSPIAISLNYHQPSASKAESTDTHESTENAPEQDNGESPLTDEPKPEPPVTGRPEPASPAVTRAIEPPRPTAASATDRLTPAPPIRHAVDKNSTIGTGSTAGTDRTRNSADESAASRQRIAQTLHLAFQRHFSYPRRARRNGWQGKLTLGIRIQANGVVGDIRILESSGYTVLDKAALLSAGKIRTIGASRTLLGGRAMDMILPVEFRLVDS